MYVCLCALVDCVLAPSFGVCVIYIGSPLLETNDLAFRDPRILVVLCITKTLLSITECIVRSHFSAICVSLDLQSSCDIFN